MSRKIRFSGFPTGETVSLSASQNGVTSGPVSVSAWKAAVSVSISRHPTGNVLPGEVVIFYVTGTSGFTGSDEYEELDFEWDFGDSGATYSVAQNLPYSDGNTEYGRIVSHAYTTTGAKTITVTLRDHATGQVGTATIPVTVDDPDSDITWDNDIYVDFGEISGTPDFTGAAPQGGGVVHVSSIAELQNLSLNGSAATRNTRITFKKGETFTWNASSFGCAGRTYITSSDSFGSGARPKIISGEPDFNDFNGELETLKLFNPGNTGGQSHFAVYGVDFDGTYDPVTGTHNGGGWTIVCGGLKADDGDLYRSFCQCNLTGMRAVFMSEGADDIGATERTFFAMHDTNVQDWSDFGVAVFGTHLIAGIGGCSIHQNPLAHTRDGKPVQPYTTDDLNRSADHGPLRLHNTEYIGITNCFIANSTGWSALLPNDRSIQPILRLSTPYIDMGADNPFSLVTGNIQRNRTIGHGGWQLGRREINNAGGLVMGYFPRHAMIIDRNEHTITRQHADHFIVSSGVTGIYARNNVYYCADVYSASNQFTVFFRNTPANADWYVFAGGAQTDPSYVRFNTMVSDRSLASGDNKAVEFIDADASSLPTPISENNIVWAPNHTNAGDFTDYTPLDRSDNFKPVTGSAAIDAVSSGTIPVRDFEGNLRGATTNLGAHDTENASAGTVAAPSYTSGLTIAELSWAAGDYHVNDWGTWDHWPLEDRYMVEWNWEVDGFGLTDGGEPAHFRNWARITTETGDLTCTITATNRSGVREPATSNPLTLT